MTSIPSEVIVSRLLRPQYGRQQTVGEVNRMNMTTTGPATAFGRHMKQWRRQSGLSQLELSVRAGMSQRHISFIETGRSRPGEDVVHKAAEALEIPIRDRNSLLEAAGLVPSYREMLLSDDTVVPFRTVISKLLESHEPYPAYVINRYWEMVDMFLAPGPVREMIDNFAAAAWTFLRRLRREVAHSGNDERLQELLARAESYMEGVPADIEKPGTDLVVCPNLRIGDRLIRTVSMVARFGTAREVTLDELRVELVFPMDDEAEAFFKEGPSGDHVAGNS